MGQDVTQCSVGFPFFELPFRRLVRGARSIWMPRTTLLSAALPEQDRPADSQSPGPQESSEADYVIVASNTAFKLTVLEVQVDSPQLRRVVQSAPRE
jgi:hypothetical protein